MIAGSEFKRQVPPIAKLGPRTAGVDYLYPRRAGPAGRRRRGPEREPAVPGARRRDPVRRRDADREPRRRHATGPRGPARGPADRRRGHADHAAPAGPVRDRDADHQLPRAERAGAGTGAARAPRGRAGPGARHRCRHARGLATRARGWWRPGPRPGAPSWRSPGRPRCSRPWRRAGSPGRAGPSRGSCRGAAASGGSGWPHAGPDERGSVLFEAPSRMAATLRDLAEACGADRPGAVCRELTKLHEQVARGRSRSWRQVAEAARSRARGEIVIVVGWARGALAAEAAADRGARLWPPGRRGPAGSRPAGPRRGRRRVVGRAGARVAAVRAPRGSDGRTARRREGRAAARDPRVASRVGPTPARGRCSAVADLRC